MINANMVSVSNCKITKSTVSTNDKSNLSTKNTVDDADFKKLLNQLVGQSAQSNKSIKTNSSSDTAKQSSKNILPENITLKSSLVDDILQYLKNMSDNSKQESKFQVGNQSIKDLIKELSQLVGQSAQSNKSIKTNSSSDTAKQSSKNILPDNTQLQTKNEDEKKKSTSTSSYDNAEALISIISFKESNNLKSNQTLQTNQNTSVTKDSIKNEINNQNQKVNILDMQPSSNKNQQNSLNEENISDTLFKDSNAANSSKSSNSYNTSKSAKNNTQYENNTSKTANYNEKSEKQISSTMSAKLDLQIQNDKTDSLNYNSNDNQTLKDSLASYKLYDNKLQNQGSNFNPASQETQLKNPQGKINIDPKSLSNYIDNNQPNNSLNKTSIINAQELQFFEKDKTKNDNFNIENKNSQEGAISAQTNNIPSAPQIKSDSNVSSNMQTIIDKILEIKNLNPPVLKTITIQLNPPSLGSLDVKVSIDSNKNLTASINVQNQDLFNSLNNNLDSLKNTLQNHGFNVAQINISSNQNSQNYNQNPQNQQQTFMQFNDNSQFSQNKQGQGTFNQTFNQSFNQSKQQDQNYFVPNNTEKINQIYKTTSYLIDIVI